MSDSSITINKLRRPYPCNRPPSNLIDDTWAADKLIDDEVEVERSKAALAPLLQDKGEMDDAVITTISGSAASDALERRKKADGRWNDLGLDVFDSGRHIRGNGSSVS